MLLLVLSTVAMSKISHKPSMKVMENLETEEQLWYVEAVLYIVFMLHPRLKIMPFKLTGYCRLRSKDGKFKQEGEECKHYGFTAPNGVYPTKTNEIAEHFSS